MNNYYQPGPRPQGHFRPHYNNYNGDRRSGNFHKTPNKQYAKHNTEAKHNKPVKVIETKESKSVTKVTQPIEVTQNKPTEMVQENTTEISHSNELVSTVEKQKSAVEQCQTMQSEQIEATDGNKSKLNEEITELKQIQEPTSTSTFYENISFEEPVANTELGLNEWLLEKGKDAMSFQHLKQYDDDNKENYQCNDPHQLSDDSYEALNIKETKDEESNQDIALEKSTPMQALEDLHKLIVEGYPAEKCEIWLAKIHDKDSNISEEPLFWDCKAAIEREKGNFSQSVECYKTAIVKGAEVAAVDESLDHLLKTFDLLDINPENEKSVPVKKPNRKSIKNDFCDVLKTSVIQFAVTQRALKSKNEQGDKQFVVTPVRRSSRLTAKSSTPGVKLCATLDEVEESVKKNMSFKGNKLLL